MIWEVGAAGRRSYLVGTAHFFPYHFRGSLRRHIGRAEAVLLEGPLDDQAMQRVVESGSAGEEGAPLYHALDPRTRRRLSRELGAPSPALSTHELYRDLLGAGPEEWLYAELSGLRPWMAFFRIWTRYRRRYGWTQTMELDALKIAAELGREVYFLETIEEQIEALNGVPLERVVSFLRRRDWKTYGREYVRHYLRGGLGALMGAAREFPTFCESIIDRRDPVLCERMRGFFDRGNAIAFVGVVHCHGITARLRAEGYQVTPLPGA